jgi:peroxiredoxin
MNTKRIQAGDRLPDATLHTLTPDGPQTVEAAPFFSGKKVVLFAIPGAFTPTCSNTHLPSFVEHADEIKAKGIDAIACVAVNDVFVMQAWGEAHGAVGKVDLLSDGNGEFTRALGMALDARGLGLGERSHRYSMLVDDGVVKTLHVEDNPGACEISAAPRILDDLV